MWQWRAVSQVHSQTALLGWRQGGMIRRINHEGASHGVHNTPTNVVKALTHTKQYIYQDIVVVLGFNWQQSNE